MKNSIKRMKSDAPARTSNFEPVSAILARMFERRGDALTRRLQAARSNEGRAERHTDRPTPLNAKDAQHL